MQAFSSRLALSGALALTFWMSHGGAADLRASVANQRSQPSLADGRTTPEQFAQWMTQLSNWGRWGKDDQLGAINLITPDKRRRAAALVKTGTAVSLAHDFIAEKSVDSPAPFAIHDAAVNNEMQWVTEKHNIDYHGWTFTHADALCHYAYQGKTYNGFAFKDVVSSGGCSKVGIAVLKDKIVTRAILLDIPRLKGLPYLDPRTHVYRADIEAWEKRAGVKISSGDAVLLRTGRWARRTKEGPFREVAGFDASVVPLLKERDVALIGSDAISDVEDPDTFPGVSYPIHRFALVALGAPLFDNLDLEQLAETAAQQNRWEFLLMAGPIPVSRGSGSPINPIVLF